MKLMQTTLLPTLFLATSSFAAEPASTSEQANVYQAAQPSTQHSVAAPAKTQQRPDTALATQLLGWTG